MSTAGLLLVLMLSAPPRRVPGGSGLGPVLVFKAVAGAISYEDRGRNVITPSASCPQTAYSAQAACPDGKHCQIAVSSQNCIDTIRVNDASVGLEEADVECVVATGSGCPCDLFPRSPLCVLP